MKKVSFHILRVGLAITFLWIGILIFRDPEGWGGYLQPWAVGLLPFPLKQAMIGTAILDIVIGAFLLIDFLTLPISLIASLHLIIVLSFSGITNITVRNIGLLAATFALIIETFPPEALNWFINKNKKADKKVNSGFSN